jgi:hypothetical protein
MAPGKPDFRWAAKARTASAFCLAGAVAGAGLYFGNLAYVRAGIEAARAAAAARQANITEHQAATSLAGLLSQSSSDRSAINDAYNDAYGCGRNLSADQQTFEQAASNRQYLLGQLGSLRDAGKLPAQMLAYLTEAWQASLSVDDDYAQWAGDEKSSGCTLQDAGYAAAETPNEEATTYKNTFVSQWDAIAAQYSLPQYNGSQI